MHPDNAFNEQLNAIESLMAEEFSDHYYITFIYHCLFTYKLI